MRSHESFWKFRRPPNILIVRTDRMGDVILSTPVLSAIKKSFPGAHTTMLIRPYTRDVVEGHPDLDAILLDDEERFGGPAGAFRLARSLKKEAFDAVVFLHPTARLALAGWLAGIPVRVGTAYRAYSFLFNRRVRQHRKKSGRHECDLNLELVAALGARLEPVTFKFHIPKAAQERIDRELEGLGVSPGRTFAVLHPGSGGSALDWPAEMFGQLARKIVTELDAPVILTGSASERKLIDRVQAAANGACHRLDGKLTVKDLAALLKRASLLVANSTGPLHLAVAVGTEVIGLYCPLLPCRPERWGPYGRPDSVLMPPIEGCEQCKKCDYGNCMELISVENVFRKARQKLERVKS